MELETPPPPFVEKPILNFHFDYLTISPTRSLELAFPKARITSVKPTKQECVGESVRE